MRKVQCQQGWPECYLRRGHSQTERGGLAVSDAAAAGEIRKVDHFQTKFVAFSIYQRLYDNTNKTSIEEPKNMN